MSTDPHVEACLGSIRALSSALAAELDQLSAEAWDTLTNCAPWRVCDVAAHLVGSGEGFVASIRRGLAGSVEPNVGAAERQRREADLAASDPATVARALRAVTEDFVGVYAGLDEHDLETICFHRRGNRSVGWYAAHRLAEVAFHVWDLHLSLGRAPRLDEAVAALLLPTLLESNAPRTYAAGLSQQRGQGERYRLAVRDDARARWLVTIDEQTLRARRAADSADAADSDLADTADMADAFAADLAITTSASTLALLVYGRADLPTLAQAGGVDIDGDPALVDRFARLFPRP